MVSNLMKRLFCSVIVFTNIIFCAMCTEEIENVNWCFDVSMMQGFYFFQDIDIEGVDIDAGSVVGANEGVWQCPDGDCDIIGAFYNDVCVGWTYPFYNFGFTAPVMMNDGTGILSDYPSSGDIPEFRLYDNSTNTVYIASSNPELPPLFNNDFHIIAELFSLPLSVDGIDLPVTFNITEIYPNPFNSSTKISYSVPSTSNIQVSVFNILGQEIMKLLDLEQLPGYYNINWDASEVPSGFYIIRLENNINTISKKVLLVK